MTTPGSDAAKWAGTAEAYADTFADLCRGATPALVGALGDVAGATVLDVGAGTGAAGVELYGRGARVVAIEPDAQMVRLLGSATGVVLRGRLPLLPIRDGAAGHAVANFVVNHLGDPRAGVRELARVTTGAVAATIWPSATGLRTHLMAAAFDSVGVEVPTTERLPPDLDFPRSADGLAGVFAEAGLGGVDARLVRWTWTVSPSALWEGTAAGIGVRGRVYLRQPPPVQHRLRDAFAELSEPHRRDGLLHLPETAVLAVGRHRA